MQADPLTAPTRTGAIVGCAACQGVFRAPTEAAEAVIECPHCQAQFRYDALAVVADGLPPTGRGPSLRWRWGLAAALSFGVLAVVAVALRVFHPSAGSAVSHPSAPSSAPPLHHPTEAALEQAFAAAARALASPAWRAAVPFVHDPERVAPLMEHYHSHHPWIPVILTSHHQGVISNSGAARLATLTATTDRGATLALQLYANDDAWRLDWEHLVRFHDFAWRRFHESPPKEAGHPLIALAQRGSATDTHFHRAGLTSESGLAVRLDGPRPGHPVIAIVPRASDLGRLFQRDLTWEHPRAYSCSLRMLDPSLAPPLVEITQFSGTAPPAP